MSEVITKTGEFKGTDVRTFAKANGSQGKAYNLLLNSEKIGLGFNTQKVMDAGIVPGDYIRVAISKNDKGYWNVDSIEKTEKPAAAAAELSGASTGGSGGPPNYTEIHRKQGLELGIQMVSGWANSPLAKKNIPLEQRFGKVVAYADHFVQYIQSGKIEPVSAEDAEKMAAAEAE